jgi:hypothetical protein
MDETFVRIAGRWMYLFRAVDSGGQTVDFYQSGTRDREAAKCFLKRPLANPDNRHPHVFARDRLRSYPAAIRELQNEGQLGRGCRHRTRPPARQAAFTSYAEPSDHSDRLRRDRWIRGSADDSQRPSTWDHQKEPARASLGIRRAARYQLKPCESRYSTMAFH